MNQRRILQLSNRSRDFNLGELLIKIEHQTKWSLQAAILNLCSVSAIFKLVEYMQEGPHFFKAAPGFRGSSFFKAAPGSLASGVAPFLGSCWLQA